MKSLSRSPASLILALGLALGGCGDDATPTDTDCPAGHKIGSVCAGVPKGALCGDDVCTSGVTCSTTATVSSDAALSSATGSAQPGTCIALAAGSYSDAVLPAGVSLLGKGADLVKLQHVSVAGGSGVVVRGLSVAGSGVQVQGEAKLESVRITGSSGVGLALDAGAAVSVVTSEITKSKLEGIFAESGTLSLKASILDSNGASGLWAQCATGCDCPMPPELSLSDVLVRDNKTLGVNLIGISATLADVEIADTHPGMNLQILPGGLAISACSSVNASKLRIIDNDPFDAAYGVLVDGATATLGGSTDAEGVEIDGNFIGAWVQNLAPMGTQPVKIQHAHLEGNRGVSLGLSGETVGFVINWFVAHGTTLETMPTDGGQQQVGDGIVWADGAQAKFDHVILGANARQPMLIDGEVAAGSSIDNVSLTDGDDAKGLLEQNFPSGGMAPTVGASAPAITQNAMKQFAVPTAPAAPASK